VVNGRLSRRHTRATNIGASWNLIVLNVFIFFYSRNPRLPENALYEPRWTSKTPVVPGSYRRCTPWLELETCCADLKLFAITPRPWRLECVYYLNAIGKHLQGPLPARNCLPLFRAEHQGLSDGGAQVHWWFSSSPFFSVFFYLHLLFFLLSSNTKASFYFFKQFNSFFIFIF